MTAMRCSSARNSRVHNVLLTRLNTAKIMMTAAVMVARGRRTHGRFTTASDTAGNHWQFDSFSGNRRCRRGERRGKMESNWYEEHVTFTKSSLSRHHVSVFALAISSEGIYLRGGNTAGQGLNVKVSSTKSVG